jgi:dipeptidyl aminopeptidase/acylaminoacyl peptidase
LNKTALIQFGRIFLLLLAAIGIGLAGCAKPTEEIVILPGPGISVEKYTPTPSQTPTSAPTLAPTFNPLMTLTPTLPPSPTPDIFSEMYIDALAARTYGGGVLEDLGELPATSTGFNRRLFRFRSDGLNMFGFINIPRGEGPFPLIFMFHGYVEPKEYATLDYSVRYADALANAGYIVLHPNLRGYAPSPPANNSLGIGDTIDALNLISLVRQQAGTDGLLKTADKEHIGLWGHSMGGGIVMRVLVIDKEIDAALLYASIHAQEEKNLTHFEEDGRGYEKPDASSEALVKLSPLIYMDRIAAPVSIHHGENDTVVPPEWSDFLCGYLNELEKNVECQEYPGQPHTFQNNGDTQFIANTIRFFNDYLKN